MIITEEFVELKTPYGPMRTHITRPVAPGRYPGIAFWTEIFQVTGPIRRTAAMLAGHGYIVAIPEVYHEFAAAGTVLAYDQAGSDRGNELKYAKELGSYDGDARAVLDHLKERPDCTGTLGSIGICLGGHLAFRTAMQPDVLGSQDPHISTENRMKVLQRLNEVNARFTWHEVNGAHAFMRDEGLRYDPELAYQLYGLVFDFFHRRLGMGDRTKSV